MHYVKEFNINGVGTKQVACIELRGKPNAATEGALGVLGMDVTSPTHDVYKCVAVNGSIYTWEFLSSGMSIITATVTGDGFLNKTFEYSDLLYPDGYIVKQGDLVLDRGGYLYQVNAIGNTSCDATYTGLQFGVSRDDPGIAAGVRTVNNALLKFFVGTLEEYNALPASKKNNLFAIITDDKAKEEIEGAIKALQDEVAIKQYTVDINKQHFVPLPFSLEEGRIYVVSVYCEGWEELGVHYTYTVYFDNADGIAYAYAQNGSSVALFIEADDGISKIDCSSSLEAVKCRIRVI